MKLFTILLALFVACSCSRSQTTSYTGSTPADAEVRSFLSISMTDSIDFIRWKLTLDEKTYELDCSYGLCLPNTNGFRKEQKVIIKSSVTKENSFIQLHHDKKVLNIVAVNANLLHLADGNKRWLTGNGGFSYALNNIHPTTSAQFNVAAPGDSPEPVMAFEGRTPCLPLADLIDKERSAQCYKLKWYVVLFTDSLTGQPSYYLQGGRQYRKSTMDRGNWTIQKGKQGQTIYILNPEKGAAATRLVKLADNILFFSDAEGNLLVGNEDFSFTLNKTVDKEPNAK